MSVGGGVRGGYVGEASASNRQPVMGDGWLWARGRKPSTLKRGKVRVVMSIGVTTCGNDAVKDRP